MLSSSCLSCPQKRCKICSL